MTDPGSNTDAFPETGGKNDATKRYYALYSFQPRRKCSNPSTENTEVDQESSQSSLSVIATNLIASAEVDLRQSLISSLDKDSIVPGSGKFTSLGLNLETEHSSSAICYSSLVKTPAADNLGFDHVSEENTAGYSEDSQQFVVSFVSFQDSSLDLFRHEFDQYVRGLVPLLDKELFVACSAPYTDSESANNSASSGKPVMCPDLSQLGTGIQSYLEQWPAAVLGYLTRTLEYMGTNIEYLIYAALTNATLQISGATSDKEDDIKRFFQCCSLSSLMEQLQPDSGSQRSVTGSSDSADLWQLQAPIVSLTFNAEADGTKVKVDPANSCTFCKSAADKLMSIDVSNVTKVRDFLESIKLAFVHNLNKLKRFLKQAELDYYALYRSLSYLKKCGCGELLLQYVKLDGGVDTLSLLSSLESFIRDMKQNLS